MSYSQPTERSGYLSLAVSEHWSVFKNITQKTSWIAASYDPVMESLALIQMQLSFLSIVTVFYEQGRAFKYTRHK